MSQTDKRAMSAVHALLIQRFPNALPKDYDAIRPLKIDVHTDLIARAPDLDPVLLRRALANHTQRDGYLLALIHGRGDHRYDLDGQPVGTVTPEERTEAQKQLDTSTKRGQDKAARVREHQEREAKRKKQREIERKNREAKAARKAEHERIQREIAARKAALIAQGITPEPRSERKRRLVREAAERAARKAQGPRSAPERPGGQGLPRPAPRPPRDLTRPAQRPERASDRDGPTPDRPLPPVAFRKKRRVVPPLDE
ncbi:MAG TPA: ProQ/FINO family protein [Candidatus Competibacter sp.]|nr:ProQ/FINO family protein [Candidatus Competibacter sp.]